MPVPARKKSEAAGRRRRSHDHLTKKVITTCSQCSSPVKPHHACLSCGFYRGRAALSGAKVEKTIAKVVKKAQKKK